VLIFFPSRPPGALLEQLWQATPVIPSMMEGIIEWPFERGRMIASSNDSYSWDSLKEDLEQNLAQVESSRSLKS